MDCSVLAAVVEVRGAGVGLVLLEMVLVKVVSMVVFEAVGLETGVVRLSLAAEEKLAAVLGFSLSHAGPGLAGV